MPSKNRITLNNILTWCLILVVLVACAALAMADAHLDSQDAQEKAEAMRAWCLSHPMHYGCH